MSNIEAEGNETQHAFLVAWGCFAQRIELVQKLKGVRLKQKRYKHSPQAKVLEFLVGQLAGLQHLCDLSLAAHPLDHDTAVAHAWGEAEWADYSGVSRTLSALSASEAAQILAVLDEVSQPFLAAELAQLCRCGERLWFDGDLTGIPVSNGSCSFPQAAYGYMDKEIRLGYQAAVVSLKVPTYGRFWLSINHHPGDTVSCTQAAALVKAAEARTGLRPLRRTDLVKGQLATLHAQCAMVTKRAESQHKTVETCTAETTTLAHKAHLLATERTQVVGEVQLESTTGKAASRRNGELARLHKQVAAVERKGLRCQRTLAQAQTRLRKTEVRLATLRSESAQLQVRLATYEAENATNQQPINAGFRLDAGFGTYENFTLLTELGYELYTKPQSHKIVKYLKALATDQTLWTRVSGNAYMTAWHNLTLPGADYPCDVALLRYHSGHKDTFSAMVHFGDDKVTTDEAAIQTWFQTYNGRQIIEAGFKESKLVFHLNRIKVRSDPAIRLQEALVFFAANFIRWAAVWLGQQAVLLQPATHFSVAVSRQFATLRLKHHVTVGAHVSAIVFYSSDSWLLKFSKLSAFAGYELSLPAGTHPP
jgi:IS4 transposase